MLALSILIMSHAGYWAVLYVSIMGMIVIEGQKVPERFRLSSQGFNINSL